MPERELSFETVFTPELKEAGMLSSKAAERLLIDTGWQYADRDTTHGRIYLLQRGVSLLETLRLSDTAGMVSDRRSIGVTTNGERLLTIVALRGIAGEDIALIPLIEQRLAGRGVISRDDFQPHELRVMDNCWMSMAEMARKLDLAPKTVDGYLSRARYRVGAHNRASLFVLGLQEGLINPELERWQGRTVDFTEPQRGLLPYIHWDATEIAAYFNASEGATHQAIRRMYQKSGTRNRQQLIMAALADRLVGLDELEPQLPGHELPAQTSALLKEVIHPVTQTAPKFGMTRKMVDYHYRYAADQLGLRDRSALIMYAIREGYVSVHPEPELADGLKNDFKEVAALLDLRSGEIAERLHMGVSGIRERLAKMYKLTGCSNRTELMVYAVKAGLLDPGREA